MFYLAGVDTTFVFNLFFSRQVNLVFVLPFRCTIYSVVVFLDFGLATFFLVFFVFNILYIFTFIHHQFGQILLAMH